MTEIRGSKIRVTEIAICSNHQSSMELFFRTERNTTENGRWEISILKALLVRAILPRADNNKGCPHTMDSVTVCPGKEDIPSCYSLFTPNWSQFFCLFENLVFVFLVQQSLVYCRQPVKISFWNGRQWPNFGLPECLVETRKIKQNYSLMKTLHCNSNTQTNSLLNFVVETSDWQPFSEAERTTELSGESLGEIECGVRTLRQTTSTNTGLIRSRDQKQCQQRTRKAVETRATGTQMAQRKPRALSTETAEFGFQEQSTPPRVAHCVWLGPLPFGSDFTSTWWKVFVFVCFQSVLCSGSNPDIFRVFLVKNVIWPPEIFQVLSGGKLGRIKFFFQILFSGLRRCSWSFLDT